MGDGSVIDSFIAAKYNLNVQDEHGYSAVILFAYHGHQTTLEKSTELRATPYLCDKHGKNVAALAAHRNE
jgi:ankyrin repeat protein